MSYPYDREGRFYAGRNITGYYAFHLFGNMAFWLPMYAVFFLARHLDFSIILYLYAVNTIFQTVLELPSGLLADRWGRRPLLMMGMLMQAAGYLMIAFGNGMVWYLAGMALHGSALAFVSGADAAFIYDSLQAADRSGEFKEVEGRAYMYNLIGWGAGGLTGGWLAAENMSWPFLLSALASCLAILVMATCAEPPRQSRPQPIREIVNQSVDIVRRSRRLRSAIILWSIIIGLLLVSHKFSQPYLQQVGIPLRYFGLIYFVWLIGAAASSNFSAWAERWCGTRLYFYLLPLVAGLALIYMGIRQDLAGVVVALGHQFAWGSLRPQMMAIVNTEAPSSARATILSVAGLGSSVVYFLATPLIGYVADRDGFPRALLYLGLAVVILGLAASVRLARRMTSDAGCGSA